LLSNFLRSQKSNGEVYFKKSQAHTNIFWHINPCVLAPPPLSSSVVNTQHQSQESRPISFCLCELVDRRKIFWWHSFALLEDGICLYIKWELTISLNIILKSHTLSVPVIYMPNFFNKHNIYYFSWGIFMSSHLTFSILH